MSTKFLLPLTAVLILVTGKPMMAAPSPNTSPASANTSFLGDPGINVEKARATIRQHKAQRLNWELATTIGDYDRVGKKDIRWDADVREALTRYAHVLAGEKEATQTVPEIKSICQRALSAGCTDPLLVYTALRLECYPPNTTPAQLTQMYADAERDMEASGYSEIRKLYSSTRAAQTIIRTKLKEKQKPVGSEIALFLDHARNHFVSLMATPNASRSSIFDAERSLLHDTACDTPEGVDHVFTPLAALFESHQIKDGGDSVRELLMEGQFWTTYGWDARTANWADKVTDEGWRLFEERLPKADAALTAAWGKDPSDPDIAIEMMCVELGQGQGRDRLEMWFRRAMNADPDSYAACEQKQLYLQPKWYGSPEDVIAFGHECLATANWASRIPFILLNGHTQLANATGAPMDYWKRPEVWADIQKLYAACLAANPNSTFDLSGYALYAYRAQQWKLASELFHKLGDKPNLRAMNCSMVDYQTMCTRASNEAKVDER